MFNKFIKINISFALLWLVGCGSNSVRVADEIQNHKQLVQGAFARDYDMEVVIDSENRLMWQDTNDTLHIKKPFVTPENYLAKNLSDTQGDTATTYCQNLVLGGFNNWRLPKKEELETLVDVNEYPNIDKHFKYKDATIGGDYWSSTKNYEGCSYPKNHIWVTDFLIEHNGNIMGGCTTDNNKHRIRCVRDY